MIRTIEGTPGILDPELLTTKHNTGDWIYSACDCVSTLLESEIFILSRGAKIKGCNVAEIETVRFG